MEPGRRLPNCIDVEGNRLVALTGESLVDRRIREAMDEGRLDDLPFPAWPA